MVQSYVEALKTVMKYLLIISDSLVGIQFTCADIGNTRRLGQGLERTEGVRGV